MSALVHNGLKSDIASGPKSANNGSAAWQPLLFVVRNHNVEWHNSWRKTMSKALEVEISAFLKQYDEAFHLRW